MANPPQRTSSATTVGLRMLQENGGDALRGAPPKALLARIRQLCHQQKRSPSNIGRLQICRIGDALKTCALVSPGSRRLTSIYIKSLRTCRLHGGDLCAEMFRKSPLRSPARPFSQKPPRTSFFNRCILPTCSAMPAEHTGITAPKPSSKPVLPG